MLLYRSVVSDDSDVSLRVQSKRYMLGGLAGLCYNTASVVNVKNTATDSRYNAALEPFAGALRATSQLCIPVALTLPASFSSHQSLKAGGETQDSPAVPVARQVCAVVVLLDKSVDTSRWSPSSKRSKDDVVSTRSNGSRVLSFSSLDEVTNTFAPAATANCKAKIDTPPVPCTSTVSPACKLPSGTNA